MFPNHKTIPLPTFNLLKSEVQVQETSLKKKKKGTLVTFPNQKKIPLPTLQLTQVRSPNPGDVSKEKKERER
jgi:hypothetical protein